MPVLDNPKHEAFAQALARGKTADEAYQLAGFKANRGNASTLKSKQNISDRVAELLGMAAERVVVDREWVIARLVENVERAMQHKEVTQGQATGEYRYDGGVANKALELLGKEIGMFVDRSENVNVNHAVSGDLPTDAEWETEHVTEH